MTRAVWFFDEDNKLFSIENNKYEQIVRSTIEQLAVFLVDQDPKVRVVAKQRLLYLKKSKEELLCRPLNPSRLHKLQS